MVRVSFVILMLALVVITQAGNAQHSHVSPYAGQEKRAIKSLSPDDIAELRRGGGWGLAKAAELNGVPGPVHLLEMKEEIALDDGQIAAITDVYQEMKAKAIQQGEALIEFERQLEDHFQNRTITDEILRSSLDAIAQTRKELRYTHLAAHLKMPNILSPEQIEKYNALRGYSNSDSCANIPQGHDAAMWRKHHRCE